MPLIWQKTSKDYSIIIWHSTEQMNDLLRDVSLKEDENREWNSFQSDSRKREFLTVRKAISLLHQPDFTASIHYDSNGKPFLNGRGHISISHSKEYIAVMKSGKTGIGIDIELIHPRIQKLSQKFLSNEEKETITDLANIEKLHVVWGAKEVLYKIHSLGNVDFKKDLLVKSFHYNESGQFKASIIKKGYEREYSIQYYKSDPFMLTWAIDE